ncbi:MAG TPA: hypothetical protein VH183_05545, partial [Burkholderiaceae bacterium]|nr:hypothetical protein [Burkholderiaceae bacterium]
MHYRPPDDPPTGSCRTSWNRPWKVTHGIVRTGRARGVRRSPFAIAAAAGPSAPSRGSDAPISERTGTHIMLDPRLQLTLFYARQRELAEQAARDR